MSFKSEKFYEKYAWIIFLIIGILILAGGIPHTLGYNTDPELVLSISGKSIADLKATDSLFFNLYNFYFMGGGLSDVGVGFYITLISIFAYRRRQLWAWFSFLFIPVNFIIWILLGLSLPENSMTLLLPPLLTLIIISIMGLLLPLRLFFRKLNYGKEY